jgi:hypothetical protein
LKGSVDIGTWVRPKFSLLAFAGRRIRLRFLGTSIELGGESTWDSGFFNRDNVVTDDGWYIDDVRMDTVNTAYVVAQDTRNTAGLATCGSCLDVVPALVATPGTTASPGQLVTLEAKTSTIDSCPSGVAQYQFWLDGNNNSIVGDVGDTLLRDFTDNSTFVDAPQVTARYGVKVRCSSQPSCDTATNSTTALVTVPCPSTGNAKAIFRQSLGVNKASLLTAEPDTTVTVSWATTALVDAIRGDLMLLKSSAGNFTGTVLQCMGDNQSVATLPSEANNPGVGGGFYYLVRPSVASLCNETAGISYSSGAAKEAAGRDTEIAAGGLPACP